MECLIKYFLKKQPGRHCLSPIAAARSEVACSFCEWGAPSLNKIRQLPMDRVLGEIDWFGKHSIQYIESCDANFGILARDVQIAECLAQTKEKYRSPDKFRASFAKYSNARISE